MPRVYVLPGWRASFRPALGTCTAKAKEGGAMKVTGGWSRAFPLPDVVYHSASCSGMGIFHALGAPTFGQGRWMGLHPSIPPSKTRQNIT